MARVNNDPKYPFYNSVYFQFLLDSVSTDELIAEMRFHKCISQFRGKGQHQPLPSQLVLLCTEDAPGSGQSASHKQMMEIMLAIYTAQGKIQYQGQGVVSTGLTAEQWAQHLAEPEQPKGSKTAKEFLVFLPKDFETASCGRRECK